jgi:hypothetical protein
VSQVRALSAEIVGWGVAACAASLAVALALGGLEGQLGAMFAIPGLHVSPRLRLIVVVLALIAAVSAIPISNAVVRALW